MPRRQWMQSDFAVPVPLQLVCIVSFTLITIKIDNLTVVFSYCTLDDRKLILISSAGSAGEREQLARAPDDGGLPRRD